MRITVLLLIAALLLSAAAWLRAPEYDEAYSIFLTAGNARPDWPAGVFTAGAARGFYTGEAGFGGIARDLRRGDVHPPLYFWALEVWRRAVGPGWFAARLLSVIFSVAGLGALAWLAAMAAVPMAPAVLLALFSYGFAYTGIVARGFALGQLLNILGVACLFAAARDGRRGLALAGGLALGAAGFSNYLACFVGVAALLWLAPRWREFWPASFGFTAFLPLDWYFFAAQRGARHGQFPPFTWHHAITLLVKDTAAAWFGGLPVYAGPAGGVAAAALAALALVSLWAARRGHRLFLLAAVAPGIGLLALGLVFRNTPIEIRYIAFAMPFLALLLAGLPVGLRNTLIAVEVCGFIGLAVAPATMQPQAAAARRAAAWPGRLVLLPYGNDGVGVPGPFIATAPDGMRLQLVKPGETPDLSGEAQVLVANVTADSASRTTVRDLGNAFSANPCWKKTDSGRLDRYLRVCKQR